MGVHQFLLYGGILAALSAENVAALKTDIMIPLYEFPSTMDANMWVSVRAAAMSGAAITGIMNPNSGPVADSQTTSIYQKFLKDEMGIGDAAVVSDVQKPKILCYIATDRGNVLDRPTDSVIAEIALYDELYPGVCSGIFFDEASSERLTLDNGDLNSLGKTFSAYNDAAVMTGKSVTFNPGGAADPVYYSWEGSPTVVGFEDFYSRSEAVCPGDPAFGSECYPGIDTVGVPRTPTGSTPEQSVILVHTASELETDPLLVKAMVEKAACSGWGHLYFTGSTFEDNPWNENTLFWDDLVTEVSQDIDITCADSAESQMRIMVPLLPDPVPSAADVTTMVAPMLDVLSKSDFGDVVSVVLDGSDPSMLASANTLRDAGARILCYLDAAGKTETGSLSEMFNSVYVSEVCGGFFLDNYNTVTIPTDETQNFYKEAQYKIRGCTVVFKPADSSALQNGFLFENDWDAASNRAGRVIVATMVDGAISTTIPAAAGPRSNSAVMMTGYSGNLAECVIADMATESYGYAYVTEATDFATLSTLWATLASETSAPSDPSTLTCSTPSPTTTPTPSPTTTSSPSPPPTTGPVVTACGTEPEATMTWFESSRKLTINGGGCADMTRISNYLAAQQITDVLSQVEPGVWELEGTLNVKVGSTVKIIGQGLGECNELRLVTSSKPSRVLGNRGNIVIQGTQIFGWKDGAVDELADIMRGYILCRSCGGTSTDQCTMTVTDSTIGHLGSGTVSRGGLSWKDICDTASEAVAQDVIITGNHRGVYARGVDLSFDKLVITGGNKESIRVDRCSGHITSCTATPPSSKWGAIIRRSPGIMITGNTMIGDKGMHLALTDGLQVTGNTFDPSKTSVRIRTTNTMYSGNAGDGVYTGSGSDIGLRVQNGGCFSGSSSSLETAVNLFILSNLCG